jgi:hypothetical protein
MREDGEMTRLLSRLLGRSRNAFHGNGHSELRSVGGHSRAGRSRYVLTAAETAQCTCPDFCERDHEND